MKRSGAERNVVKVECFFYRRGAPRAAKMAYDAMSHKYLNQKGEQMSEPLINLITQISQISQIIESA